jgi:uncharacterized protein YecT (DUF1311 family)
MTGRLAWLGGAALGLSMVLMVLAVNAGYAQTRRPTGPESEAIRTCAKKYADDVSAAEQHCVFNLVATPCTKTPKGSATVGEADCYSVESVIWDNLLNENFQILKDTLDDEQTARLRDMQRAWIAYRDTTCHFYDDKIRGSMAIPMHAACVTRETARRALLLKFFSQL